MLGGRSRRSLGGSATAVRITAILTAVGFCLAAAAYATVRYSPSGSSDAKGYRPLRPRITVHPDQVTTAATAEFDIAQPGRPAGQARPGFPLRYECRIDAGLWSACSLPETLNAIGRGYHRFIVRAVNRAGSISPATGFIWRRVREPRPAAPAPEPGPPPGPDGLANARPAVQPPAEAPPTEAPPGEEAPAEEPPPEEPETPPTGPSFRIEQVGTLAELFPGAAAQTIGVRIYNPNPVAITITSLTAAITNDPPECPPTSNFVLTPAPVAPATPLVVPAESAVSLAEAGIEGPTIAMVDLPISQDACEAADLEIELSGEAIG